MKPVIDLNSERARKARLGHAIGPKFVDLLFLLATLFLVSGLAVIIISKIHYGYLLVALSILLFMFASWTKWELLVLKPQSTKDLTSRLSGELLARLNKTDNDPKTVWNRISNHWQCYFYSNHLFISPQVIETMLDNKPESLEVALNKAAQLADANNSLAIEIGYLAAGLLLTSQPLNDYLIQAKLTTNDVEEVASWLARILTLIHYRKQNYGGIGRDWSYGFTNFLNHFARNLSLEILNYGSNFGWLTNSNDVISIENALSNNSGAIALIGPTGIGKTSRVYALAQRLIEGRSTKKVAYHQILELDASSIISNAKKQGDLENIFIRIVNEASHAGHVILFLDDAELFFNQGAGSLDATSILQPILQNRLVQFILALTPEDYQRLRTNNMSIANLITPVIISELPEKDIMDILEDTANGIEHKHNCLITYDAIKTAYHLSGRYNLEEAYPGKAIKLLEQSLTYGTNGLINQSSIESAIEHIYGVKVATAGAAEAESLLNLEDQIHQIMINQNEAVKVVSAALRRARSGIGDPKRPIGSFLFLGPTGVGKTELAKAIAKTYFGDINNIVRLDMSEYQQEQDVSRLLQTGSDNTISFLMSVRRQPFCVVLLDEIEKAHPNILNLLLQLIDEGRLTDTSGRSVSFKDAIIIATSNAGANIIREQISKGISLEDFKESLTDQLIKENTFKPELLNRFDDVVLFRPLNHNELAQVVGLLLKDVNANLSRQNISIELTKQAIEKIVNVGNDDRYGARPMRRALQRGVEDSIAQKILKGEVSPGSHVIIDAKDIEL